MLIEVLNIALPLETDFSSKSSAIPSALAQALGIPEADIASWKLLRRSVDARKSSVNFIASFAVDCGRSARATDFHLKKGVCINEYKPVPPLLVPRTTLPAHAPRPIVVGSGPAGLFAAIYLTRAKLKPVLIEQGADIKERVKAVRNFMEGGSLDLATNIQFGAGGAGTFSDGKLNTNIKSPFKRTVLEYFVEAGGAEEILWQAKPHIGTDQLVSIVENMCEHIREAGGEIRFNTKLDDIVVSTSDGKLSQVVIDGQEMPCSVLVLACGHSARDTFKMLQRTSLKLEAKPFSVGVRIEHLQEDINRAQYGNDANHPALGAADYKMAVHLPNKRSVYTFCMCPGGEVVPSASEENGVVVNGMSSFKRAGGNANSALLVNVEPDDFESDDPLAGVEFQRHIEQAAYSQALKDGGTPWQAPAQTVGDFLGKTSGHPSKTITPTYARGVVWSDLHQVLPDFVSNALKEALPRFDRKLPGFAKPDAVMTGVETRSSSPVRIVRDKTSLQASRNTGIYPAGEGSGYAGGIMSAACDGLRIGERIVYEYALQELERNLGQGLPAIFPTDTVYGIGVAVRHAKNLEALYRIKKRDAEKPVAWLIGSVDDLDYYGMDVSPKARELAEQYWPGALTIIVKASDKVPKAFQAANGTIGLRVPDNKDIRELIGRLGPLAASSANITNAPAPRLLADVEPDLLNTIAYLKNDEANGGIASSVIDCSDGSCRIIRQGELPIAE